MRSGTVDSLHEVDASAAPPIEDQGSEEDNFSKEDMDTLPRSLSRVLQPPGAGF